MHASLQSVRLAPKKANLMASMVRGMTVPDATELLRRTTKKSARLFEGVLHSAVANAQHNFKQNPQGMILKTVVVNKGMYYRRGTPMARGRVRPLKKFLCHISITLGYPEVKDAKGRSKKGIPEKPGNPESPEKGKSGKMKKPSMRKKSPASPDSPASSQ